MKKKIIIGSRGSKLALLYAERAKVEILKNREIESVEIKSIKTSGDVITDARVSEYGGKGLKALFANKLNIFNPKFIKMILEMISCAIGNLGCCSQYSSQPSVCTKILFL